jgi:hypothetical protein
MKKKNSFFNLSTMLLGVAVGAGATAYALEYFRKHPEKLPANFRRQLALDKVFEHAHQAGAIRLQKPYHYVIFSDHHKGARDQADDFQPCEATYLTALDHYYHHGFTLIEAGDVEELWENEIPEVMQAYTGVFQSSARFYPDRYLRLGGNHDDAWETEANIRQYLDPFFPGIQLHPQLLFEYQDEKGINGKILIIHGHQGTWDADIFKTIPPLILPYYRILQNMTGSGRTSPSQNTHNRGIQDNQMYTWVSQQEKLILIAGHTHRPIWSSMTHLERLVMRLQALQSAGRPAAEQTAEAELLQAEIARRAEKDTLDPQEIFKLVPCYFNTGCCRFGDGDITGIEIEDDQMSLIKWGDLGGKIDRTVLESSRLANIFAAI